MDSTYSVNVQHSVYKVIVVDDEPHFNEWLSSLLRGSKHFDVLGQAYSSAEAINLITSNNPDLVIADIFLPESDGLELSRYIHQNFKETKVILMSVHEEHIYKALAREEGALAFIPKSQLTLDALLQVLQREM